MSKRNASEMTKAATKAAKQQKLEEFMIEGNAKLEEILTGLGAKPAESFGCYIISKGRPNNVNDNLTLFKGTGVVPHFIVGKGDVEAYQSNGATKCIEGGTTN